LEGRIEHELGHSLLGCDFQENTDTDSNIFRETSRYLMSEGGIVGIKSGLHEVSSQIACQNIVLNFTDNITEIECAVIDGNITTYLTESGYGYVEGAAMEETLTAIRSTMNEDKYEVDGMSDLFFLGVKTDEELKPSGGSSSAIKNDDVEVIENKGVSTLGISLLVAAGACITFAAVWFIRKKRLSEAKVY